jgi:hypothetical protein
MATTLLLTFHSVLRKSYTELSIGASFFWFIWQLSFREDFLEINQSETRIVCGGHVC